MGYSHLTAVLRVHLMCITLSAVVIHQGIVAQRRHPWVMSKIMSAVLHCTYLIV